MANRANTSKHQPLSDEDCERSAEMFDRWRAEQAEEVWREQLPIARARAEKLWRESAGLTQPVATVLADHPDLLPAYRAATTMVMPREVLATRSNVGKGIITGIEQKGRAKSAKAQAALPGIAATLDGFLDRQIAAWLAEGRVPTPEERQAFTVIIADRMARATADAILRNLQERRQEAAFCPEIHALGYRPVSERAALTPGTYALRRSLEAGDSAANIPVDALVAPLDGAPLVFVELKSAGDATNTNKRRKEESARAKKIRETYGRDARYVLVLGGYFDRTFVAHIRGDDIEWIWEHDIAAGTVAVFGAPNMD